MQTIETVGKEGTTAGSIAIVATLFRFWAVCTWTTLVLSLLTGGGFALSPQLLGFTAASGLVRGEARWYRRAKLMLVFDIVWSVTAGLAVLLTGTDGGMRPMRLFGARPIDADPFLFAAMMLADVPFLIWQLRRLRHLDVRMHFEGILPGDARARLRQTMRYEAAMALRYGFVVLAGMTIGWMAARPKPPARVTRGQWDSDRNASVDSVARAMSVAIGAPPSLLARCGPGHVIVHYRNAPIDLKPAVSVRSSLGGEAVGQTVVEVLRDADPSLRSDTVTVRLERRVETRDGWHGQAMMFTYPPSSEDARPPVTSTSCERYRNSVAVAESSR